MSRVPRRIAVARLGALVAGTLALLAPLAGRADELKIGPDRAGITVAADPALAAKLPATVKTAGTMAIATDPTAPPYEFYAADGQTLIGADIDLGSAIAAKLGLKPQWSAVKFPGIIAAILARRFDTALAGMGDTPAREKQLDFIDYSTDGNAIVVKKGNPLGIKTVADLCGHSVAVLQGSVMQGLIETQDKTCTQKIEIQVFQDDNQALLQVRTGRADATMYQYGVAAYIIKTSPDAAGLDVLSFQQYGTGYNAMPFRKTDTVLIGAVQAALEALKAEGTYGKILAAWGMGVNGVGKFTIDDGVRFAQPSN